MTTVSDAFSAWLRYRKRLVDLSLVARSTFQNQAAIGYALTHYLGEHQLDQLRKSHVEIYIGERLQTCVPITVRGELNVLRQVLNWAVDEQLLIVKPRLPTVSVPATEAALPSDDAFLWVLRYAPEPISRALEFMMLTGLSPHELERLQAQDCPRSGAELHIGMRADFPVKQPSRRRTIPLSQRAMLIWIQESLGRFPDGVVFPRVGALQRSVARLRAGGVEVPAGADKITPKMMRKWFASKVAGEQPEHVLQRLMGHAPGSPITRRHYVRSDDNQTRAAVDELPTL